MSIELKHTREKLKIFEKMFEGKDTTSSMIHTATIDMIATILIGFEKDLDEIDQRKRCHCTCGKLK